MFESLTQMITYYNTHEFSNGIHLGTPVNEDIAKEREAQRSDGGEQYSSGAQSEYVDVTHERSLEPQLYHARTGFQSDDRDALAFSAGADIVVVDRAPGARRWRGYLPNCPANIGWFPADTVIRSYDAAVRGHDFDHMSLAGCLIGRRRRTRFL
jgi:hypothetical protein